MGMLLAFCVYMAYAAFVGRIVWRILIIWESSKNSVGIRSSKRAPASALKAVGDIFLFSRLFRMNPRLWIGEWIFHLSFVLVLLGHLRYVLEPVPGWVKALQPVGIWAGYTLPFTLAYILILKRAVEKKRYVSTINFSLLGILLFMSITGLLMRIIAGPDMIGVKNYMIGIMSFTPGPLPDGALFKVHLIAALVLLTYLPAHIFTAPFSIWNARKREDRLDLLMHEE